MAKLEFSKSALHKEGSKLKRYKQYLPSLDLKRQQLMAERVKAFKLMHQTEEKIADYRKLVEQQLPMLSNEQVQVEGLVSIDAVTIGEENVVGVKLPVIEQIEIICSDYSMLSKPHWVDHTVKLIKQMLELELRLKIDLQRIEMLQYAVKKVTQRLNLFEKVLIPRSQQNIRKIRIFLSDAERAAVVRAKITKQKRLKEVG